MQLTFGIPYHIHDPFEECLNVDFAEVLDVDVANKSLTKAMTAQARNRGMKIYMDNSSVAASENILLYTHVEEINIDVKINVTLRHVETLNSFWDDNCSHSKNVEKINSY